MDNSREATNKVFNALVNLKAVLYNELVSAAEGHDVNEAEQFLEEIKSVEKDMRNYQ